MAKQVSPGVLALRKVTYIKRRVRPKQEAS